MALLRPSVIRLLLAALLAGIAALPLGAGDAPQDRLDEYQVKAAFLYNFAKFVQWPVDRQSGSFVITIVGDDPFGRLLDDVVLGKTVHGRTIELRRQPVDEDMRGSHVVFVGAAEERRTAEILRRLPAGVLTVGESPHFVREGGIIRFFIEGNHVRFQVNAQGAEQARLKINAQLLSLSKR